MKRNPLLIAVGVIVVIGGLALAWWLVSPLFLNQTVDESFPITANATLPPNLTRPQAEATMVSAAQLEQAMTEPMPESAEAPVAVRRGSFRDADSFHKGSGEAVLYRQPDGSYLLRLENFTVTNGPDLFVYFSPSADPKTAAEAVSSGYIELARLKGNRGSQNYEIPATLDLSGQNSVVIWCRAFGVLFSVAPLQNVN